MGKTAEPSSLRVFLVGTVLLCLWGMFAAAQTSEPAATQSDNPPQQPVVVEATNPHWVKNACNSCHQVRDGKLVKIEARTITTSCIACHDGRHAHDEIHPIDRAFNDKLTNPSWPLVDGKLQCQTCHDVRMQCDATAEASQLNPNFLRTVSEDQPPPFCGNCHRPGSSPRFSPHFMLTDDKKPNEQRCQICHTKTMDPKAGVRTGNAFLREDQSKLCTSCHAHHKNSLIADHVGKVARPEMLTFMRAREITGLLVPPGQAMLTQLAQQKARPTLMVPQGNGQLVCTTCHSPHPKGLFPTGSVLDDRALVMTHGQLLTPTRGQTFCNRCHSF